MISYMYGVPFWLEDRAGYDERVADWDYQLRYEPDKEFVGISSWVPYKTYYKGEEAVGFYE